MVPKHWDSDPPYKDPKIGTPISEKLPFTCVEISGKAVHGAQAGAKSETF